MKPISVANPATATVLAMLTIILALWSWPNPIYYYNSGNQFIDIATIHINLNMTQRQSLYWIKLLNYIILEFKMQAKQGNSSQALLERICQQIQQQISSLLSNLSSIETNESPDASIHTNSLQNVPTKSIQKSIISTKNSIMRVLLSKLPQIVAIENKCKKVVGQIGDELNVQKSKFKELFVKYEQIILDCDRYKMETVQISHIYQQLYKQHMQLKRQVEERKQNMQQVSSYNQQQRTEIQNQLLQLRRNQLIANQRIYNLMEDIQKFKDAIEEKDVTMQMLKQQIADMVIHHQQLKLEHETAIACHQQHITQFTTQLDQLRKEYATLQSNYTHLLAQNKQLAIKLQTSTTNQSNLSSTISQLQASRKIDQQKFSQLQIQASEKQATIASLKQKCEAIQTLKQSKQSLQGKYIKKIDLLNKHIVELKDKIKHYKAQNQRLYEAMEMFASKELKLASQVKKLQQGMQSGKRREHELREVVSRITGQLVALKRQMNQFRLLLNGKFEKSIKSIVSSCNEQLKKLCLQMSEIANQKLLQYNKENQIIIANIQEKLDIREEQLKLLNKTKLDSQINSNRIVNALIAEKNELYTQLSRKDQIIGGLQIELGKEKQFNQISVRKLGQVVKKYERDALVDVNANSGVNGSEQVQKMVRTQRARFAGLQNQYKAFLQK